MNKFFGHLNTVVTHKKYVRQACFKMGLYWQGITHDLSKFTPIEFFPGVKYFLGYKSPTTAERAEHGYSKAWLHHKGKNKHHFEYWTDYTGRNIGEIGPVPMPLKYIAEMTADRYAACRTYYKDEYNQTYPLMYFNRNKNYLEMHEDTKAILGSILQVMADEGEDACFEYVKKLLREEKTKKK